jgi:DNA anti-recombination protein RmuC
MEEKKIDEKTVPSRLQAVLARIDRNFKSFGERLDEVEAKIDSLNERMDSLIKESSTTIKILGIRFNDIKTELNKI